MERKNLIRSALTVMGRSGLFNRAASRRGIRLAPLLLIAVMLAAVAVLAETSNPAQTVHAHEGDDHRHFSCPGYSCTYDDVPAESTVWSATLTVGNTKIMGRNVLGWDDSGGFTGASLTDQDFTFGGDTYEIDQIYVRQGGGLLGLGFDTATDGDIATRATRYKLTLQVGGDSFNLGAGTFASNQRSIIWVPGLSWSAGETSS